MGVKIINLPDFSGLPENGDYFVVTDGTVTAKLNYNLLAQAIIEQYSASSIMGENQTLQSAFSALNGLQWKYLGVAPAEGATFTLPEAEEGSTESYLLLTGHNSTGWLNTLWLVRPGSQMTENGVAFQLSEGTMSSSAFTWASGFTQYAGGNSVVRRNGIVSVHLIGKNINAMTISDTNTHVVTLPEGFRPVYIHSYLQQGSTKNFFRAEVQNDGKLYIQRYGVTQNVQMNAGSWLNLDCTYVGESQGGVSVTLTDRKELNVSTRGGGVGVFICKLPTEIGAFV